jgi:23S rRNA (cytidine1920-2'-O)/16S rRNA (cytidine1409-2'-O)-methyltransferase
MPGMPRLDEAVAERTGVTRSRARSLILAGRVRVDGRSVTKPGTTIPVAASIDVERPRPYVSRGGEKLEGALRAFEIDVRGKRALDIGASTGGFTDCLLAHGAAHVTALDVGYGQIAVSLRDDPRVDVIERCNFRLIDAGRFGAEFDIITIDASFISVIAMIDRARAFLRDNGSIVALVKPQFEAGRARLGGGGVVRDPQTHRAILEETIAAIAALGLTVTALVRSPLRGPAGNVEFFVYAARGLAALPPGAIDAALA